MDQTPSLPRAETGVGLGGPGEEDWHARGYRVATWPRSPEGSFTNVSVRFAKRFAGGSLRWRRTARTTARVSSNRG